MIDPNIIRWMAASTAKVFNDAAIAAGIKLYLNEYSGTDFEWAEFRFDGPQIEGQTIGTYRLGCTVNILITAFISSDNYRIYQLAGIFASAADQDICCFKYGDGDDDDQSQWGTLQLIPSNTNKIDIVHYGIISATSQHKRSSIEAMYELV